MVALKKSWALQASGRRAARVQLESEGRAAIQQFYEGIVGSGPRKLAVGRSVADSHRVAFELINLLQPCNEDDPALAVDVMDINEDGQIQEFTVFSRPRRR